ncbi:MAG: hypothetical protein RR848_07010 [Oscillospiraceae bacterium]
METDADVMRSESKKIALCGITGGLAATLMLMGGILPFATFCAPAIAGILIVPVAIEYGKKIGMVLYLAIGILSIVLVPDKEMALIFIFLLGYYPLLKAILEHMHKKLLCILAKFAVFNVSVLSMYGLILLIFPMGYITEDFSGGGFWFAAVLLLMGNITFFIYDLAITRVIAVYCISIRPKLFKQH